MADMSKCRLVETVIIRIPYFESDDELRSKVRDLYTQKEDGSSEESGLRLFFLGEDTQPLKEGCCQDYQDTTNHIKPQVANVGGNKQGNDEEFRDQGSPENRTGLEFFDVEACKKHAQDGAIKQRAKNIDELDEVVRQVEQNGKDDGYDTPSCGE